MNAVEDVKHLVSSQTRLYDDYKQYCYELGVVLEKPSYYNQSFNAF